MVGEELLDMTSKPPPALMVQEPVDFNISQPSWWPDQSVLSQMWPCWSRLRYQPRLGLMASLGRLPDKAEAAFPAGVSGVCTLLPHLPLPHP